MHTSLLFSLFLCPPYPYSCHPMSPDLQKRPFLWSMLVILVLSPTDPLFCEQANENWWVVLQFSPVFLYKPELLASSCWFLAWLILQSWRWRWHIPLKHQLTFNRLQGIISQKTESVITIPWEPQILCKICCSKNVMHWKDVSGCNADSINLLLHVIMNCKIMLRHSCLWG
jgi:hypothetical protein